MQESDLMGKNTNVVLVTNEITSVNGNKLFWHLWQWNNKLQSQIISPPYAYQEKMPAGQFVTSEYYFAVPITRGGGGGGWQLRVIVSCGYSDAQKMAPSHHRTIAPRSIAPVPAGERAAALRLYKIKTQIIFVTFIFRNSSPYIRVVKIRLNMRWLSEMIYIRITTVSLQEWVKNEPQYDHSWKRGSELSDLDFCSCDTKAEPSDRVSAVKAEWDGLQK